MILGNQSMDSGRRPLCGCFVLSRMVGGIFRKPLGFRRRLPPARPEKAKPFQAGQSPCTKHQQTVRLRLYALKKVFEGSKGRFFKNAPWQGVGQRPTKGERTIPTRLVFSDGTKSRHETLTDRPALPLCPQKVFEGSKGRFSKTRSWQGEGGVPQKEIQTLSKGTTVKAGNLTKSLQKPYRTMGEGRKGFCYTVGATKTTKKG